jgi:nitrogen fixation NifU-like protein
MLGTDPARGLAACRELHAIVREHDIRHIDAARAAGYSWEVISWHRGGSKQAAYDMWRRAQGRAPVRYPAHMSLDDLYREVILDHYRSPRNKRPLSGAEIDVHRNNPLCGDDITVHVAVQDGIVTDAAFEGQGCSISQASASMLTERIKGRKFDELEDLVIGFRKMMAGEDTLGEDELGDLVALKGVAKYPVRIKCAVLAWDALQEGLSHSHT